MGKVQFITFHYILSHSQQSVPSQEQHRLQLPRPLPLPADGFVELLTPGVLSENHSAATMESWAT